MDNRLGGNFSRVYRVMFAVKPPVYWYGKRDYFFVHWEVGKHATL